MPIVMILSLLLTGCMPVELKATEEVAEGVVEVVEYMEKEKSIKVTKSETSN